METKRILVTVKTYPHPSRSYQELVCTAGMLEDGTFIRLYPVDFRYRPLHQWYEKYQWIEVEVERNPKDFRPESYRPNLESIRLIGEPLPSAKGWAARKQIVLARPPQTMCALRAVYDQDRTSLGIIRPHRIDRITVRPTARVWESRHQEALAQFSLFDQNKKPLQKIPHEFSYEFVCDDRSCRGHNMLITDWELGALYLKEVQRLGSEEAATDSVVSKFHGQLCAPDRDTHLFVGTTFPYNSWIVLGVFYPRMDDGKTKKIASPSTQAVLQF